MNKNNDNELVVKTEDMETFESREIKEEVQDQSLPDPDVPSFKRPRMDMSEDQNVKMEEISNENNKELNIGWGAQANWGGDGTPSVGKIRGVARKLRREADKADRLNRQQALILTGATVAVWNAMVSSKLKNCHEYFMGLLEKAGFIQNPKHVEVMSACDLYNKRTRITLAVPKPVWDLIVEDRNFMEIIWKMNVDEFGDQCSKYIGCSSGEIDMIGCYQANLLLHLLQMFEDQNLGPAMIYNGDLVVGKKVDDSWTLEAYDMEAVGKKYPDMFVEIQTKLSYSQKNKLKEAFAVVGIKIDTVPFGPSTSSTTAP